MRMGDEAGIAYGSVYMGQRAVEGETIGPPWFASKKGCCWQGSIFLCEYRKIFEKRVNIIQENIVKYYILYLNLLYSFFTEFFIVNIFANKYSILCFLKSFSNIHILFVDL